MTELFGLALSSACGIGLAVFYFGGLWLTLQRLPDSKQPALLTLGSFLGRSAVCLLGFYLILGSGLQSLAFGLAAFVLTKLALTYRLGLSQFAGR
ncbi:N-ATPase, AtpR subunit [uncultured archaeon]|nr:N-ATPase, AtpR subunit [uncultured archaeon]